MFDKNYIKLPGSEVSLRVEFSGLVLLVEQKQFTFILEIRAKRTKFLFCFGEPYQKFQHYLGRSCFILLQ
jgi:hypothetical protein